jgi:hypothetical protein
MATNADSGNCQLLYDVDSENPERLYKDENFDYYKLILPNRVSIIGIFRIINLYGNHLLTLNSMFWLDLAIIYQEWNERFIANFNTNSLQNPAFARNVKSVCIV